MALLLPNQIYELSINTPYGMYTYKFATKCSPLYSTYEQLLLDTGLTQDQLSLFDGLRVLHHASLICNDILERANRSIPEKPDIAMREYTRFKAALDLIRAKLRNVAYNGRESVTQRLGDLSVERRPVLSSSSLTELQVAVRNLEREVAYWEARLRGRTPIASAVKGINNYPNPFAPRRV